MQNVAVQLAEDQWAVVNIHVLLHWHMHWLILNVQEVCLNIVLIQMYYSSGIGLVQGMWR